VVFVLALLIALFFVPSPWSVIVILAGAVAEVGEVIWGRRLAQRWRPRTGAEAMIGETARVVAECRPRGQVRVRGELWEAVADEGADPGDTVRIEAIDGLTLVVARVVSGEGDQRAELPPESSSSARDTS
jgi:membrane protein implicated in regulation of membrane protease activity